MLIIFAQVLVEVMEPLPILIINRASKDKALFNLYVKQRPNFTNLLCPRKLMIYLNCHLMQAQLNFVERIEKLM